MVKTNRNAVILDLNRWRGTQDNRVLAGRDLGRDAREKERLDEFDKDQGAVVCVVVPSDFLTVSSSFFRGMFGDSIRALGEDEFRAKYQFTGKSIERVKEDGIRDALREAFPLGRS